ACQGQIHAFDSQDLIDVYILDGPETILYCCQTQGDLPPDPAPEPEPEEGDSEEGVSESESADPARPASPTALAPASAVPDPPPPPQRPPSPPTPIMSSPAAVPNKEMLKLLLPLRYDGKTVIEYNRFLSQLRIYWLINTSLTTIELKRCPRLGHSILCPTGIGADGRARGYDPIRKRSGLCPTAFKAHFGNLDDEAAAQVELAKLCTDKSVREKCTAAEFSTLFKGPADRSGYGDLELCDKYLSGIPSRVYRKIELETFTTWQAAEKRATEVKQILDISWARRPELNNFFSMRGRGRGGARGGAPQSHKRQLPQHMLRLWEARVPTLQVPQL
ncbi:hypothetical protein POSPLADRAFT_1154093, partial [Postia placenta MAD-698-R-SB12]